MISGTQAINRAIDIIDAIASRYDGASPTDLLSILPLSRRTIQRILHGLLERGILTYDSQTKKFFINHGSTFTGKIHFQAHRLPDISKIMADVLSTYHVPMAIYCQNGVDTFVANRSAESYMDRCAFSPEGLLMPIGNTLPSFGILSILQDNDVATILQANAADMEAEKLHSCEYIYKIIDLIRRFGFICCQGSANPHFSYIVFPLLLKENCPSSLCAQVVRDEEHDQRINDIISFIYQRIREPDFVFDRIKYGEATQIEAPLRRNLQSRLFT